MTRGQVHGQDGFTLVEMLVALAIFALLAAAGVAILRSSVATQSAIDMRLVQIGGMGRLHALLSSDLGQAADRPTRAPAGERPAFFGDAQRMEFVRSGWSNLDGADRPDLQRVRWSFSGQALTRTGMRSLDGGDEGSAAAPFYRSLASATFRYRLADGGWRTAFSSTRDEPLPTAVELLLTPSRGAPIVMIFELPRPSIPQAEAAQ